MGNLSQQIPLIRIGLLTIVLFVGVTALILWTEQRPLNAEEEALTAESTPIVVSNPSDAASEYRTFTVIVEDQTIVLNQKTNEQMVIYNPPAASPTPVPTVQEVAAVEEEVMTPTTPPLAPAPDQVTPTPIPTEDIVAVPDGIQDATATPNPTVVVRDNAQTSNAKTLSEVYRVQSGDNLFRLACRYNSSIAMFSEAVSTEDLIVGTDVILTYPNPNYCGGSAPAEYAVKEGDTIFKLAQLSQLSVSEIQSINGLLNEDITAGDVLCFPNPVPQNC